MFVFNNQLNSIQTIFDYYTGDNDQSNDLEAIRIMNDDKEVALIDFKSTELKMNPNIGKMTKYTKIFIEGYCYSNYLKTVTIYIKCPEIIGIDSALSIDLGSIMTIEDLINIFIDRFADRWTICIKSRIGNKNKIDFVCRKDYITYSNRPNTNKNRLVKIDKLFINSGTATFDVYVDADINRTSDIH